MTYENQPNYTIKAAAARTELSQRTIERWIAAGLQHRKVAGIIIIDHNTLMTYWRARMIRGTRPKKLFNDDTTMSVG